VYSRTFEKPGAATGQHDQEPGHALIDRARGSVDDAPISIAEYGSINRLSGESTRENRGPSGRAAAGDAPSVSGSRVGTVSESAMFGVFSGLGLAAARQGVCRSHERLGIRAERMRKRA
jgi:hypothetical protein